MNRVTKISDDLAVQNSFLTKENNELSEEIEGPQIDTEETKAVKNMYKTFVAEKKFKTE